MTLIPHIMDLLHKRGLSDVPVFLGGIIPENDAKILREMGVTAVFGPGTETGTIVKAIKEAIVV